MESLNPGATAPSPPTHTSIPEAKQSLAPPHPGKGRRGFLEEQGLRLCEMRLMREGVRCWVSGLLQVGSRGCVSMRKYYGTGAGNARKRNWDGLAPGFLEQENLEVSGEDAADGRRSVAVLTQAHRAGLGCEWWKPKRPAAVGQKQKQYEFRRQHRVDRVGRVDRVDRIQNTEYSYRSPPARCHCPLPAACCRVRF